MKKLKLCALIAFLCAFSATAQTNSQKPNSGETPYKNYYAKFVLDSEIPEQTGFGNPKSFWQFRYELRFLEKTSTSNRSRKRKTNHQQTAKNESSKTTDHTIKAGRKTVCWFLKANLRKRRLPIPRIVKLRFRLICRRPSRKF